MGLHVMSLHPPPRHLLLRAEQRLRKVERLIRRRNRVRIGGSTISGGFGFRAPLIATEILDESYRNFATTCGDAVLRTVLGRIPEGVTGSLALYPSVAIRARD